MGRARQLAGRGDNDSILMDASAASTDENEKLLLDGTDSSYTNAGFDFLQEDFGTDVSYDNLDPNIRELTDDAIFFYVTMQDNQTISHNTATKVSYSTVWQDHNGNANMADDPSRFTCTVPGLYYFQHHIYLTLGSADASILSYYYNYLKMNGTYMNYNARSQGYSGGSGFQWHMFTGSNILSQVTWLSEGDYIEGHVYMYKTGGDPFTLSGSGVYSGMEPYGLRGYLVKRLPI